MSTKQKMTQREPPVDTRLPGIPGGGEGRERGGDGGGKGWGETVRGGTENTGAMSASAMEPVSRPTPLPLLNIMIIMNIYLRLSMRDNWHLQARSNARQVSNFMFYAHPG